MKRILLLAVFAALPGFVFAGDTSRYLVATRHSTHGAITKDPADTPRGENVREFTSVDGYAADLTAAEVAELRNSSNVLYVEPVIQRHAMDVVAEPARDLTKQTTPYGISLVRAPETWPVVTGKGINVAIIDTGIDYNHPELKGIFAGGYNTFTKNNDPLDDNGHGTHCAGIIAAANNTQGVVGVAPDVKLWSVKVLDSTGSGSTENVISALDWVIAKKAELGGDWIVSLSLGSSDPSNMERAAFSRVLDAGILAIAASGNESTATTPAPVAYPAAYAGMLSVGAVDSASKIASFSNQGPTLSVVAPGVNVLSTVPTGTNYVGQVTSPKGLLDGAPLTGSKLGSITGPYVYCNLGRTQDFTSAVAGKIALIKRGDITFNEKTRNALKAGATAVVIFNKDNSSLTFTLIGSDCDAAGNNCVDNAADKAFAWPIVVAISQTDGEALAALTTGGNLTVATVADDYALKSGTSMATPHVSGVAALVWSAALDAKSTDVKAAIEQTAFDLGATGRDSVYGFGLVDALSAAKQLAPSKFAVGATPDPSTTPTGRTFLKRGGH